MQIVKVVLVPGINKADLCRENGIGRQRLYEWITAYEEFGEAGLVPKSKRPHHVRNATPLGVIAEIVRLRKTLRGDKGADIIAFNLTKNGFVAPTARTIHRILVREGLVVPEPKKRPRSSWKRFEFDLPNACWQIDATEWQLANGTKVMIMDVLDDHSRVSIAAVVGRQPTVALAWEAMTQGMAQWGIPARVLSDNGLCFKGSNNTIGAFERNCAALGIEKLYSAPYHPQTCGKIERSHQTLKKWLSDMPPAKTMAELQKQVDEYRDYYNSSRPHRATERKPPILRWNNRSKAIPKDHPIELENSTFVGNVTVTGDGNITIGRMAGFVGKLFTGQPTTVVRYGTKAIAFIDGHLIATFDLDLQRRYQPATWRRTEALPMAS